MKPMEGTMNDQIHYGSDGSLWLHSDLWGRGSCGDVAGFIADVNWATNLFDGIDFDGWQCDADSGKFTGTKRVSTGEINYA
jgi:hypothetical protein